MIRRLAILLSLPLFLWAPGCVYDLDVEGKACNTTSHICPGGYHCSLDGNDGVCKVGPGRDGGDEDAGGDHGNCFGNEFDCKDTATLLQCDLGEWEEVPCESSKYCTDFGGTETAACVDECSQHEDCTTFGSFYCNQDNHHCEAQGDCRDDVGVQKCNSTRTAVVMCEDESFLEITIRECTAGTQYCDSLLADCRNYCTTDADCFSWPDESCNLSTGICETVSLCDSNAWCTSAAAPTWIQNKCSGGVCECTADGNNPGVCVIKPLDQASTPATIDISCFPDATTPPASPANCDLEGLVVSFANGQRLVYNEYVEVHVHTLANVLNGVTSNPVDSATVTDDGGYSRYSISGLPTNTELVLDVHCNDQGGAACTLHPMYTFVIYLRADDCQAEGGTLTLAAPSIDNSLWQAYSTAGGKTSADPNMGVAFGRLRDCVIGGGNAIMQGTGDISMSYFQFGDNLAVFYPPFGGPPEEIVVYTLEPGLFGAANVLPIRGLAAALIRYGANLIWLRTYPFRVFPQSASLILFDKPKIPR
jgi:hypothetical protein